MSKRKFILKATEPMKTKDIDKFKEIFKNECLIVPSNFELQEIDKAKYQILTKDMFMEYRLCKNKPCNITKRTIEDINKYWDKVRNGYEFVILAGDMIYNVDYFNEHILGGESGIENLCPLDLKDM